MERPVRIYKINLNHYVQITLKSEEEVFIYGKLRARNAKSIDLQPAAYAIVKRKANCLELVNGREHFINELKRNNQMSVLRKDISDVVRFETSLWRLYGIKVEDLP